MEIQISCNFNLISPDISCSETYQFYHTGLFLLNDCNEEIISTNESHEKVSLTEKDVILARCLIDADYFQDFSKVYICSKHRLLLGKKWYQSKKCCNSNHDLSKSQTLKSKISFSKARSLTTLIKFNLIDQSFKSYGYGSLICKKHFEDLNKLLDETLLKYAYILNHVKRLDLRKSSESRVNSMLTIKKITPETNINQNNDSQVPCSSTNRNDNAQITGSQFSETLTSQESQCFEDPEYRVDMTTWKEADTPYKKNKLLDKIVKKICGYLEEYQPDTINILFEILNLHLLEKEFLPKQKLDIENFKKFNKQLILAYNFAPNNRMRAQILSIIVSSDFKHSIIQTVLGATDYQIRIAKKHSSKVGPGGILEKKMITREKIKPQVLSYFLEYLEGEDLLHDVAYGTRTLKTVLGKIVIPEGVRQTSNSNLIRMYHDHCQEQGMEYLSRTTCFKILNKCSASFRTSLKGLDSYKAEGLEAFDKLEEIVEALESVKIGQERSSYLKNLIETCRNYLKYKFRKNLKKNCECSDHCVDFALSEFEEKSTDIIHELGIKCDHNHKRDCLDCLSVENLFNELDFDIKRLIKDDLQSKKLQYYSKLSRERIFEWKYHIIRGFNQDIIKYSQLEEIKDENSSSLNDPVNLASNTVRIEKINNKGSIQVIKDFAMKFEVTKHMETQAAWFAKRGLSWHVTVLVFNENKRLQTVTLVHLLEDNSQDSNCILGIADSVFSFISKNFVNTQINIRSDNAGCYHSQDVVCLLTLFANKYKIKLNSYHFSEPQLGKDICDRKISVLKKVILQFINDGNDVNNIKDMFKALTTSRILKDTVVFACKMNSSLDLKNKISFQGISKYHSFEYLDETIKFFRYYSIGKGVEINIKNLINIDYQTVKTLVNNASLEITQDSSSDFITHALTLKGKISKEFFLCEECEQNFLSQRDLDFHESLHKRKINQIDQIQIQYAKNRVEARALNYKQEQQTKLLSYSCEFTSSTLEAGFAIKVRKLTRFTEDQLNYLKNLFEQGVNDPSKKVRALAVESEMIELFEPDLCLSSRQITSYFSKLNSNRKKMLVTNDQETEVSTSKRKVKFDEKETQKKLKIANKLKPKRREALSIVEEENYEEQLKHEEHVTEKYQFKLRSRSIFKVYTETDIDEDEDFF